MYCTSIAVSGLILTVSRSETRLRWYRVVSQNQWVPRSRATNKNLSQESRKGAVGGCNHCLVRALGTCFHQDLRIPESFFTVGHHGHGRRVKFQQTTSIRPAPGTAWDVSNNQFWTVFCMQGMYDFTQIYHMCTLIDINCICRYI